MAEPVNLEFIAEQLRQVLVEQASTRERIAELAREVKVVRDNTDGIPLLGAASKALRRVARLTKAAVNDIAATNVTAGEVAAMHDDIDRVQTKQDQLDARLATIERRLDEPR